MWQFCSGAKNTENLNAWGYQESQHDTVITLENEAASECWEWVFFSNYLLSGVNPRKTGQINVKILFFFF